MTQTNLGIEIDGDRITVVETVGEMAVSMRTVSLDNPAEAVDLALAGMKIKRTDPPIRVSLASPSMVARRIDVTAKMQSRSAFEDAVYTALPVDRLTTCSAGMFFDQIATDAGVDQLSPGVAAIATRPSVDAAYRALNGRKGEVVPAPFVFEGFDGMWLGIRYGMVDITLVTDGHVVGYRQLRNGGLDVVAGLLVDPNEPDSGRNRLESALHRVGLSDPVAESELDRWMRAMATEIRTTIDFWTRSGEIVPNSLIAYGAGASAVGLDGALSELAVPNVFPESLTRLMAFIAPADRPAAVSAYFASRTTGLGMPQAAFVDPGMEAQEAITVKRNRRALTLGAGVVIVSVVLASVVIPTVAALIGRASATHERDVAREQFSTVSTVWDQIAVNDKRTSVITTATQNEIDYAAVLRAVTNTAPAGYRIGQISANTDENGMVRASLSVTSSGGTYEDLTRWLERLRTNKQLSEAWSTSFSDREGVVSYQLTVAFDKALTTAPIRTVLKGDSK